MKICYTYKKGGINMSALIEFKNIVKSYTMGDITINVSDGVNFIAVSYTHLSSR